MDGLISVSGGFCIGHFDVDRGSFEVCSDVLGQYNIFIHSSDGQDFIISNNLYAIRNLLTLLGRSTSPDIDNLVLNCLYLSSFNNVSPVKCVKTIPSRMSVSFDSISGLRFEEKNSRKDLLQGKAKTYKDAVRIAAEDISSNCNMIVNFAKKFGIYTSVDLTGGMDSRLMLAGFLSCNKAQEVNFFNIDGKAARSVDRVVSDLLSSKYSLIAGTAPCMTHHSNVIHNSLSRPTIGATLCYGSGHFFGRLPYPFEDFGDLFVDGFMRVSGFCGEHTRAPHPHLGAALEAEANPRQLALLFTSHWTKLGGNNFYWAFLNSGKDVLFRNFQEYFGELLGDVEPRHAATFTYVENRSRCHFGLRGQNGNRNRIAVGPLASPSILALHRHLNYHEVFNNKIGYDLMLEMAGPELCELPFAKDYWRSSALGENKSARGDAKRAKKAIWIDDGSVPSYISRIPIIISEALGDSQDSSEAFPNPIDDWRTVCKKDDSISSVFSYLLDECSENGDLWAVINRSIIYDLSNDDTSKLAAYDHASINIQRLAAALTNYVGAERTSKLSSHINFGDLVNRDVIDPAP